MEGKGRITININPVKFASQLFNGVNLNKKVMLYIGVDLHQHYFFVTVMDEKGKVLSEDKVETLD